MKRRNFKIITALAAFVMGIGIIGATPSHVAYAAKTIITYNVPDIFVDARQDEDASASILSQKFIVTNNEDEELDLSKLRLQYYYTKDGSADETFNCYYAGTGNGEYKNFTSNVVGRTFALGDDKKSDTADTCLEVTFNGGVLAPKQSIEVTTAVNKNDWSAYDKTNDYSAKNHNQVVGLLNDKIEFGEAPFKTPYLETSGWHSLEEPTGDSQVSIRLNGYNFEGIEGLEEGKDYSVGPGATTVYLKKSYLDKAFEEGKADLKFKFSDGFADIYEFRREYYATDWDVYITTPDVEVKKGETVTIPITFTGKAGESVMDSMEFLLWYNDHVLENVKVTKGNYYTGDKDIESWAGAVDNNKIRLGACSHKEGKDILADYINTETPFAYVTFTVKENCNMSKTGLYLSTTRTPFLSNDKNEYYKCGAKLGDIIITDN